MIWAWQHMSHRIAVMKDGEVVEKRRVDQIFRAPRHPWTRQLLSVVGQTPLRYNWSSKRQTPLSEMGSMLFNALIISRAHSVRSCVIGAGRGTGPALDRAIRTQCLVQEVCLCEFQFSDLLRGARIPDFTNGGRVNQIMIISAIKPQPSTQK